MRNGFFALIGRMRSIRRWGLMRNSYDENLQEHSHRTAVLAHALAMSRREVYGEPAEPDRAAVLADCLGRLGDERALPVLMGLAASEETPYLDYIELRNAIERLGGEAPERNFDAEDPAYEAMRNMQ